MVAVAAAVVAVAKGDLAAWVRAFFPNYGGQWNLQVAALVAPPAVASALLSLRRA